MDQAIAKRVPTLMQDLYITIRFSEFVLAVSFFSNFHKIMFICLIIILNMR